MHNDGGKTQGGGLQGVGATGAGSAGEKGSDRADFSTSVAGATQKTTGEGPERYMLFRIHEPPNKYADHLLQRRGPLYVKRLAIGVHNDRVVAVQEKQAPQFRRHQNRMILRAAYMKD